MLLRRANLADGLHVDVRIDGERIAAVEPCLDPNPREEVHDLDGYLLVPAPAEPHAHLDKAMTADRVPNPDGDLLGAVRAWMAYRSSVAREDFVERAEQAARLLLANGVTAVRTHVDVGADIGTLGVEALVEVRERLAGLIDLQIVALVSRPVTGVAGAGNRAALADALSAGADLVGGAPHLDADPAGALDYCLEMAGNRGLPIDLHTDETLVREALGVRDFAGLVTKTGFTYGATASHCVSLGVQDEAVQRVVAEEIADAGVAVVTLPQTNLYLMGRNYPVATPRGLTALRPLLEAGATVAAGADNLQDPFNLVGRGDPLETAALLVMAGHLSPPEAYHAVSTASRAVLGLEPVDIAPGAPAELLAVQGASVREAIAMAPARRVVIHRGRIVFS
jgi:cytosine deaminase